MSDSFFAKLRESADEHGYFAVLTVDFEDEGRDYDRRDEFVDKGLWQRFEEPLNFFALDTKEPIELFKLGQKSDSLDAERALLDFALVEPKQDLEAFLADERWASLKD